MSEDITRRKAIVMVGGLAAVALAGCESDPAEGAAADDTGGNDSAGGDASDTAAETGGSDTAEDGVGTDTVSDAVGECTVYPQQTEGPFYLDLDSLRQDVTEDREGTPLTLVFLILGGSDCQPVSNVAVDIWQCDADGVYSGYPNQLGGLDTTGERFLRGTQLTDAEGLATFLTIYPGWYPGRTTHIHFKVHPTESTEATSQLYFPEDINEAVYETAPYSERGQKDTSNTSDLVNRANPPPLVVVTGDADGYTATLTVTIAG